MPRLSKDSMKPILVLYPTREGHTQRIAANSASSIRSCGFSVEAVDAAHIPVGFRLDAYSAAIIAASVHRGLHEQEIIGFVTCHLRELECMRTAFLSVSLSEAGAEDSTAPPERRAQATADVERMIADFLTKTRWHPSKLKAVAGALLYTKYNFLLRFVMKRIVKQAGAAPDKSTDHEYTDWAALDQLVDEFVRADAPVA